MRLVLTLMPPVPFSDTQRGRVRHPAFGPNPVRVLLSSSSQIRASSVTLAEAPIRHSQHHWPGSAVHANMDAGNLGKKASLASDNSAEITQL